MNNSINNLFINAIGDTVEHDIILVKFYNRSDLIQYPSRIMDLLKSDKHVQDIIDPSTYEIIFTHDNL